MVQLIWGTSPLEVCTANIERPPWPFDETSNSTVSEIKECHDQFPLGK